MQGILVWKIPLLPPGGSVADCLGRLVWDMRVGAADDLLDRGGMTSGVFCGLDLCTGN